MLLIGYNLNSEVNPTVSNLDHLADSVGDKKPLIPNKYHVNLPKNFNTSEKIQIYDGSWRYFTKETYRPKSFDCSTEKPGCVKFEPNKTYLECEKNYGIGNSAMKEYCVTTNRTKSVSLRTDDRLNDITAPLTDEQYKVIKGGKYQREYKIHGKSDFLNKDVELINPWDLVHLDQNRYLVTELNGIVHDIKDGESVNYNVDVLKEGPKDSGLEDDYYTGLLGAAKHPDFSENNIIYLNYAYDTIEEENVTLDRISKFKINRSEGTIEKLDTIIDGIPGRLYYHGGRLRFGPDEKYMYVTTGSADYDQAQNSSYLGGKVLRFYPNGSIPETNPYGNSVYAKGLRNPQGIDFNPDTGAMYISQHGPYRRDNIAKVGKGTNLGWPDHCRRSNLDAKIGGEILCTQTWTLAPSGITFVDDENHEWYGDLFVSALRGRNVHRIQLENGKALGNEIFWFNGMKSNPYPNYLNQLRDVEFIDGDIWVLHDNGAITRLSDKKSGILDVAGLKK